MFAYLSIPDRAMYYIGFSLLIKNVMKKVRGFSEESVIFVDKKRIRDMFIFNKKVVLIT